MPDPSPASIDGVDGPAPIVVRNANPRYRTMNRLHLSTTKLVAFASPAAPISALGLPLVVYLPPFYAEEMDIGLALVGTVFMITRFWDVVTDPLLGVLSDRFKTRWGRRRPWIVASVPIVLLAVWRIFAPDPPVGWLYLLGWMIFLYVGWTLLTISHMSWGAELTPDYDERSRVQAAREVALLLGVIAVLALPAVLEQLDPSSTRADRVALMGWFIVLLLPVTVAWAVSTVPEREAPTSPPLGWRRASRVVATNAALRRVLVMDAVSGLGGGIISSLFLFLSDDFLQLERWSSLLLLIYFISGVSFIAPMVRVSYRFGKHRTLAFSSIFTTATVPLILLVPPNNPWAAAAFCLLVGVNLGVAPFLFRSIMADVADQDRVESGAQRTGLYYSLLTMTNKVGYALSIGIVYPLLEWIGYTPGAENSPEAIAGLAGIFVWPPCLMFATVAWLMWNFPIDRERQQALRREIELQEGAATGN